MQNGKIFFIAFIAVLICLLLYLFKDFLMVIAIGSLMAVATSAINAKFLQVFKGQRVLSASLTTLLILLFFFAPFVYAVIQIAIALKSFDMNIVTYTIDFLKNHPIELPESLQFLQPKLVEVINDIDLNSLSKSILTYFSGFTKSGLKFFVDMVLIIVFYFFANLYGSQLIIYIKSIVPIDEKEFSDTLSEVGNVMAVVLYSMVFVAIFQGALFAIIVSFFGYDGLLIGIIFAFSSLIPAVGGALVYIPISLYEFATSGIYNALWIILYSFVIISCIADTLIKPLIIKWINKKLVKTPTQINELLIFLAMIAGISSFGFWGIILGPAILTFFISTIKMCLILKAKKLL